MPKVFGKGGSVILALALSLSLAASSYSAETGQGAGKDTTKTQALSKEELALWNACIGDFRHAYVVQDDMYTRVPDEIQAYLTITMAWHKKYVTVTGPRKIKKFQKDIQDKRDELVFIGGFEADKKKRRHRDSLPKTIARLERQLAQEQAKLRAERTALARDDFSTLLSRHSPTLEKYEAGELGNMKHGFQVESILGEKAARVRVTVTGERFWLHLRGWPADKWVTDGEYTLADDDNVGRVSGTRAYETAAGGTRNALLIERIDVTPYVRGLTQEQFVAFLKSKGTTRKEFVHVVYRARKQDAANYVTNVVTQLEAD